MTQEGLLPGHTDWQVTIHKNRQNDTEQTGKAHSTRPLLLH